VLKICFFKSELRW